jgi:hypothetical protein
LSMRRRLVVISTRLAPCRHGRWDRQADHGGLALGR